MPAIAFTLANHVSSYSAPRRPPGLLLLQRLRRAPRMRKDVPVRHYYVCSYAFVGR